MSNRQFLSVLIRYFFPINRKNKSKTVNLKHSQLTVFDLFKNTIKFIPNKA